MESSRVRKVMFEIQRGPSLINGEHTLPYPGGSRPPDPPGEGLRPDGTGGRAGDN